MDYYKIVLVSSIILEFVRLKMLFSSKVHLPEWVSLTVISAALIGGIVASLMIPEATKPAD